MENKSVIVVGSHYYKHLIHPLVVSRRTKKTVWFLDEINGETYMKRIKRDVDGNEYVAFDAKNFPYVSCPEVLLWGIEQE